MKNLSEKVFKTFKMAEELENKLDDLVLESSEPEEDEIHTEEEEAAPEESEKSISSGESSEEEEESSSGTSSEASSEAESQASGRISDKDEESDTESQQPPAQASTSRRKRKNPNKWLKEVNYYQKTTDLLIPKQSFRRLVREIAEENVLGLRFTEAAFEALQTATEDYLVQMFEDSQLQAIARGNDTIMPKDIHMVMKLKRQRLW